MRQQIFQLEVIRLETIEPLPELRGMHMDEPGILAAALGREYFSGLYSVRMKVQAGEPAVASMVAVAGVCLYCCIFVSMRRSTWNSVSIGSAEDNCPGVSAGG